MAEQDLKSLKIRGDQIDNECEGYSLGNSLEFLDQPTHEAILNSGKSLSSFASFVGNEADDRQKFILKRVMNLSHYADEATENMVPVLDIDDEEEAYNYTICIQRSMWILPGVVTTQLTPEVFAKYDYHKRCQPASCHIWDPKSEFNPEDDYTFRLTKSVISYIYDVTIQFRVSKVPEDLLPSLTEIDNLPIHKALLLERTKRDRTRQDSTKKVKSLLMFHQLSHGVLVSHITGVLNTSIPTIIANLLPSFHERVATEVAETCTLTRQYWEKENKEKQLKG